MHIAINGSKIDITSPESTKTLAENFTKYLFTFCKARWARQKNMKRKLRYQFINAFPKSISPIPVTYGAADLMKVTVSFNYDRYIVANEIKS